MVLLNIQVQHFVTALRWLDWIKTLFSSKCVFLSNVTKYFISFHFYKTYLMFATLLDKNSLAKYSFHIKFIIWQSQNKMYTQSTIHVEKPAAFIEINVSLFTYLFQQLINFTGSCIRIPEVSRVKVLY